MIVASVALLPASANAQPVCNVLTGGNYGGGGSGDVFDGPACAASASAGEYFFGPDGQITNYWSKARANEASVEAWAKCEAYTNDRETGIVAAESRATAIFNVTFAGQGTTADVTMTVNAGLDVHSSVIGLPSLNGGIVAESRSYVIVSLGSFGGDSANLQETLQKDHLGNLYPSGSFLGGLSSVGQSVIGPINVPLGVVVPVRLHAECRPAGNNRAFVQKFGAAPGNTARGSCACGAKVSFVGFDLPPGVSVTSTDVNLDMDDNWTGTPVDIDGDGDLTPEPEVGDPICTGLPPHTLPCADNCPGVYNPDQIDTNGNSIGDACEVPAVPAVSPRGLIVVFLLLITLGSWRLLGTSTTARWVVSRVPISDMRRRAGGICASTSSLYRAAAPLDGPEAPHLHLT